MRKRAVLPIIDVEIVSYTQTGITDPVVDVALVPAPRQLRLPTLADLQATPRARSKGDLLTKLDRAIAKKAARLDDARKLKRWALAVKTRDQWKDRKTGLIVRSTRSLDPLRAEAHHVVSKDDWAVRYDVRNGITLSFATHFAVEHLPTAHRGNGVLREERRPLHRRDVPGHVRAAVILMGSVKIRAR